MLSSGLIILLAYNLFAIFIWTAVLVLVIMAAYNANTWLEFGDTYADGTWLQLTTRVAQGLGAFDVIFAFLGWTKNGVTGPFL